MNYFYYSFGSILLLQQIIIIPIYGKQSLDYLRPKFPLILNSPNEGCWENGLRMINEDCFPLKTDDKRRRISKILTECQFQALGMEIPVECSDLNLKKMNYNQCLHSSIFYFQTYNEYYIHLDAICYFLDSRRYENEMKETVRNLKEMEIQIVQNVTWKMVEIGEKLNENLNRINKMDEKTKVIGEMIEKEMNRVNLITNGLDSFGLFQFFQTFKHGFEMLGIIFFYVISLIITRWICSWFIFYNREKELGEVSIRLLYLISIFISMEGSYLYNVRDNNNHFLFQILHLTFSPTTNDFKQSIRLIFYLLTCFIVVKNIRMNRKIK